MDFFKWYVFKWMSLNGIIRYQVSWSILAICIHSLQHVKCGIVCMYVHVYVCVFGDSYPFPATRKPWNSMHVFKCIILIVHVCVFVYACRNAYTSFFDSGSFPATDKLRNSMHVCILVYVCVCVCVCMCVCILFMDVDVQACTCGVYAHAFRNGFPKPLSETHQHINA